MLYRIRRSLAVRGAIGTAQLCANELFFRVWPAARRVEERRQEVDRAFDEALGVDTGGIYRPSPDSVVGNHWPYGVSYQAVDPGRFLRALDEAEVDYRENTFLDLGCGKGRALLLAAGFPFRKLVGVEYCEKLHDTARANVASLPMGMAPERIELRRMDAAEVEVPDGPLTVFLYNPFAEVVMRPVVERFAAAYRRKARQIVVIYFTAELKHLWLETGIFELHAEEPAILRSQV